MVSISASGLVWASHVMGNYGCLARVFYFAVGRTSVPLFRTPDISIL